jgi:hypothetical protein
LTLRYHLVSLVAVFLALALGVALGSTSVSQRLLSVVAGDRDNLSQQVDQLGQQRDQLRAAQRAGDSFAASVAPTVVKDQLDQRSVVLVVAPDAVAADRDAVRALIGQAGGTVTGEVDLTDALVDPARADQIRDLTTRLLPAGAQLPSATDAGGLVGGLLGSVLLAPGKSGQTARIAPDQATAALAGLSQAGFVKPVARPAPAQLAVVVTGGSLSGANAAERAATVARLATELDHAGGGAVLAGRSGAADSTGPVGVVRADTSTASALSTVDDVQSSTGRVATVLALREQAQGRAGRYGEATSAQSVVPGASAG